MSRVRINKTSVALCMNTIDDMPEKNDELLELSKKLFWETMKSLQDEKTSNKYREYIVVDEKTSISIKQINLKYKFA